MPDLDINKDGFDGCVSRLQNLAASIGKVQTELEESADTSAAMAKEIECAVELAAVLTDLAALAEETAKDVKLTKARYVLADAGDSQ